MWRFRCSRCGKTFTRLPSFVLPYKQYVVGEVEGVLRQLSDDGNLSRAACGADGSTLERWQREFSRSLPQWAGALESLTLRLTGRMPKLVVSSHPLKRLEEALSLLPALPLRWATMVKTLWWLWISHPLCLPCPP